MSRASRKLQIGDLVTTDFNRNTISQHLIVERKEPADTGSGIAFKVHPVIPRSSGGWIDADWFEPVVDQEGVDAQGEKP